MAIIRIKDLALRTIIGINDWEREKTQDVLINLVIDFDARAASASDDVADTVNYKTICKKVIAEVEGSRYFLIEKLGARILDLVFEDARVQRATVEIDKPHALRFARSVSLTLSRQREL